MKNKKMKLARVECDLNYPDEAVFSSLEVYYTSDALEERYTELWNTVKASA